MAMRRPRIKPVANIQQNAKRKAKNLNDIKTVLNAKNESKEVEGLHKQDDILTVEGSTPALVHDTISLNDINEVRKDLYDTPANKDKLNGQDGNSTEKKDFDDTSPFDGGRDNRHERFKIKDIIEKKNENVGNDIKQKETVETYLISDCNAFKCPPKVDFQRSVSHISNSGVDDVFYSDIEENALQMDMENPASNVCPMSPSKIINRQRIKPTPHFGKRRNSFVGTSPSPHTIENEESNKNLYVSNEFVQPSSTRRERHHSASVITSNHSLSPNQNLHHTPHKHLPSGRINNNMGRIRTESGCSVFSDTNTSPYKLRKHEDNKQNLRKEFEARFFNGVPEKTVIKMSDLIYYNPVTNPMEQKPNPNVKLEQTESSKDVKTFDSKEEKETEEKSTENDGVPVPQLKLNAKGELILDDKSLVIETTAEQEARKVLANSSLIYLDENTGMNGFYSRQKRTREWLPSETVKFYRCLQNVGTDFSLMVSLFPNRTRRDLKLKFKKEERKNANLINKALLYPKQFNLEALKQQIDDEEKLREEKTKNAKSLKDKVKRSKKRKLSTSAADRVLQSDVVYQNENVEKPKRTRKTVVHAKNIKRTTINVIETDVKETCKNESNELDEKLQQNSNIYSQSNNIAIDQENQQINEVEVNINESNIDTDIHNNIRETNKSSKLKRRRRPTPNKLTQKEEIIIIKEEIIKIETKQDSNNTLESAEYLDGTELQTEMDELLNTDIVDKTCSTNSRDIHVNNTLEESQMSQQSDDVNNPLCSPYITQNSDNFCQADMDSDKYENSTIINLDDSSVNVYNKTEDFVDFNTTKQTQIPSTPPTSQSPIVTIQPIISPQIYSDDHSTFATVPLSDPEIPNENCSSVICEKELNEEDIQSILTELADGSLVLVSSLDPEDPDKVLNEIYMVDKNTGDLCDEPLSIPDNIVQCILSVLS